MASLVSVMNRVFGSKSYDAGAVQENTNYSVTPVTVGGQGYEVHLLRQPAHTGTNPANQAPFQLWASEQELSLPLHYGGQGEDFIVFRQIDATLLVDQLINDDLLRKLAAALKRLHSCPVELAGPEFTRPALAIKFAEDGGKDWTAYDRSGEIMETMLREQARLEVQRQVGPCHFNLRPNKIGLTADGKMIFLDYQCSAADDQRWELGKIVSEFDLSVDQMMVFVGEYNGQTADNVTLADVGTRAFYEATMTFSWDVMRQVRTEEAADYHRRALKMMPPAPK